MFGPLFSPESLYANAFTCFLTTTARSPSTNGNRAWESTSCHAALWDWSDVWSAKAICLNQANDVNGFVTVNKVWNMPRKRKHLKYVNLLSKRPLHFYLFVCLLLSPLPPHTICFCWFPALTDHMTAEEGEGTLETCEANWGILLNLCSCGITGQCNTQIYLPYSTYVISDTHNWLVLHWLKRGESNAVPSAHRTWQILLPWLLGLDDGGVVGISWQWSDLLIFFFSAQRGNILRKIEVNDIPYKLPNNNWNN